MVHIPLFRFLPDGIQLLVGGQGIQRGDRQHLGLAAGKEAGTVYPGQNAYLGGQRTDLVLGAPVHTVTFQKPRLDDLLLELIGDLVQILIHIGVIRQKQLVPFLDQRIPARLTDVLIVGIHGGLRLVHGGGNDLIEQHLVEIGVGILELGLADLLHHTVNEGDLLLVLLVGGADRLEHHVVRHFVGAGFDHDHFLGGGNHRHVQIADLALLAVGVEHQLAVHQTDLQRAYRAVPGNIGDRQRGGGADQGGDLRRAVVVHTHDGAHHRHVVAEIIGKQGANGAVDDTGGQDPLLTGTAFPAVEAAGNTPHGVELLLKIHAQGEEIHAVTGTGCGGHTAQYAGLAVGNHNGGVGKLRQLAHLQREGPTRQIHGVFAVFGKLPMGNDG